MKIKSLIHIFIAVAVVAVVLPFSSCKKYLTLNPVSSFGPDAVFGTVANAQKAVFGAYQELAGDQGYGIRLSMYYPYDNDCFMGAGGHNDNDRRDLGRYNLHAGNAQLAKPFNQLYSGIEKANQCIKYIPQMSLYKSGTPQEQAELRRLYGEALTLRAEFYFELVRTWGNVPAEWKPSSDQPDLFLKKTDQDTIYAHIIGDLKVAETLVPWPSGVSALGDARDERITKGAVKGLRARIALFAGGYKLHTDKKMERPANYKSFYAIADSECLSVIQSGEYSLDPSFEDLWKNQLDAHQLDPYNEIMFQVAMAGASSSTDSKIGYYDGPGGSLTALPTYFYKFDSMDTRRDVTIAAFKINKDNTLAPSSLNSLYDGKFRRNWISNPTIDISNKAQNFGLNWPVLRYSDVLLMYAEAENEINQGPTAGAVTAFNQVRDRAFGGDASAAGTPPTDYQGFFNAIMNERALEFGAEGIRKYDLIRWDSLGAKLAETRQLLQDMADSLPPYDHLPGKMYYYTPTSTDSIHWANSFYKPTPQFPPTGTESVNWVTGGIWDGNMPYFAEGFKEGQSEVYPIPQQSIDANPNLTQDYGY